MFVVVFSISGKLSSLIAVCAFRIAQLALGGCRGELTRLLTLPREADGKVTIVNPVGGVLGVTKRALWEVGVTGVPGSTTMPAFPRVVVHGSKRMLPLARDNPTWPVAKIDGVMVVVAVGAGEAIVCFGDGDGDEPRDVGGCCAITCWRRPWADL